MENATAIGRLAPSPTGAQHVGNARTYLLAWLGNRFADGKIYLRMEDIDSPRVKSWASQQAVDEIRWLGLDWDQTDQKQECWTQTERVEIYQKYLDKLKDQGKVYRCFCSRKDIQQAASAPHESSDAVRYPGTCRPGSGESRNDEQDNDRTATEQKANQKELSDAPFAWRLKTDDQLIRFEDQIAGEQSCRVQSILGDFVLGKSDGSFSYQLASTIDDQMMGINQVVRGDDLIQSTFRQLTLQQLFGWPAPTYFHVPLVTGPDGRRLAKRHGDTRLSVLVDKGKGPEHLIGLLGHSLGLTTTPNPISAINLLKDLTNRFETFPWDLIPKTPFVLTPKMWHKLLHGT